MPGISEQRIRLHIGMKRLPPVRATDALMIPGEHGKILGGRAFIAIQVKSNQEGQLMQRLEEGRRHHSVVERFF